MISKEYLKTFAKVFLFNAITLVHLRWVYEEEGYEIAVLTGLSVIATELYRIRLELEE